MNSIISILVAYNQLLLFLTNQLMLFIVKNIPLTTSGDSCNSPKYKKYTVDELPVIKSFDKLDYKQLIKSYLEDQGKILKPVKSRGANPVPSDIVCPRCGAPHVYLYDNTGGRGQLLCKVCNLAFSRTKSDFKAITFVCPHCGHILDMKKHRKVFDIHKCINPKCSYYLNSIKNLSPQEIAEFQESKFKFKLHYIYREFKIDFFKVDLSSMPKDSVNLKFRKFSPHVMGLTLTYLVNCSLSTRMTKSVMREVHGVKISHVTISNYAKTAAALIKPFVDDYDYKPTNYLAADETYVKVKGINHYVWFIIDAIKKSILGYQVSHSRDVGPCILAMRMAFSKFKVFPGKALKFVADGYTAYLLARQQFELNDMDFDVTQVIGLTNDDPVSTEYRWLKQIIERLNRTFKFSYRVTNGYSSYGGSNTHVALFVAFYNFLRPHSYNYWRPLNEIPELVKIPNMPGKWQKLIELSQKHILTKQTA